jgi:LPS sulfotransferase NodH
MLPTGVAHAIRGNDEETHSTVYVSNKPIVLLSVQRSGTNFLRQLLGSHPAIDPLFGEILDPNHIGNELSFFHFYERAVADNPSLCLPDQRITAFEKYIEFLDKRIEADYYILDIKYNSIRQMESYWSGKREVLAQYIIDKQWPVIHLIRTDLLAATFSQIRARKTGVYVTKAQNYRDTFSGAVDAVQMVKGVAQRKRLIQQYRRDFGGARILEIAYEDVINAPNGISEAAMGKIRNFLGVTDEFSRTPETTKLITQPMSQAIENYDEVLAEAASRKVQLAMPI